MREEDSHEDSAVEPIELAKFSDILELKVDIDEMKAGSLTSSEREEILKGIEDFKQVEIDYAPFTNPLTVPPIFSIEYEDGDAKLKGELYLDVIGIANLINRVTIEVLFPGSRTRRRLKVEVLKDRKGDIIEIDETIPQNTMDNIISNAEKLPSFTSDSAMIPTLTRIFYNFDNSEMRTKAYEYQAPVYYVALPM